MILLFPDRSLKEHFSNDGMSILQSLTTAIGRVTHTGADEAYFADKESWDRWSRNMVTVLPLVEGDVVRDWTMFPETWILFPYDKDLHPFLEEGSLTERHLWKFKQFLVRRREPGGTHAEIGLTWYEWSRFQRERFRVPLSITFAFVATHNHFVLDRGGKVFNRSAPVIKLPADASEGDHLGLLGLLNSSVACFWLKQIFHNKGSTVDQHGARQRTDAFEDFYEFTSTGLKDFPLPANRPLDLARKLDQLAQERAAGLPGALLARAGDEDE
jgi:hypothetical protein